MGTPTTVLSRTGIAATAAGLLVLGSALPALAAGGSSAKDPAGNNGTFKIEGSPYTHTDQRNEPHVSCSFELEFMNFDSSQLATITFTGQAPTPGTIRSDSNQQISDGRPASGAAKDHDLIFQYGGPTDPAAQQKAPLDLTKLTPVKQGYHIKVDVTLASGQSKHKVFWMTPCATGAGVLGEQKQSVPTGSGVRGQGQR